MSDQRTKVRLAVSEFQSALRTVVNAEREFARAHGPAVIEHDSPKGTANIRKVTQRRGTRKSHAL